MDLIGLSKQHLGATKRWSALRKLMQFEAAIDVTLGSSASIVGGLPWGSTGEIVTGGSMSMVIDPLGWLEEGDDTTTLQKIMPTGEWSGLFGNGRSLHYGTATSIHHGSEIDVRGLQSYDASNERTAFMKGIIGASTAMTAMGWLRQKTDATNWDKFVRLLGPRGVSGILLNQLIHYEVANGQLDCGLDKQLEAESLTAQTDALCADYLSLILDLAGKVTEQGATLTSSGTENLAAEQAEAESEDTSIDDAEDGADAEAPDAEAPETDTDTAAPEEPEEFSADELAYGNDEADVYQCYDGLVSTGARHISLRARAADDEDTDPSLIHLDANGADGEDNGVVAINSTGQATIVCGPAAFQIRRDGDTGQIDATTGDEGTITFTTGGETGSKAVMDPDGIQLSVGAEGAGALITMTSDGIKLSVGPEGGPCLELTTSGVTMSCGANSVAVDQASQTTSAMNVSHEAQMAYEAKGTMATVEGSAMTTVKGGITMIN